MNHRESALWGHATMLSARLELAGLHRAMRLADKVVGDLRVDYRRAIEYRDARDELADRATALRLEIEAAEANWAR